MSKLSFHGYRIPVDVNISLLEKTLENLKNYLKVDKKETSVQRRSKISAADDRPSAMITGSILGVTILVLLLSTIVLSDLHVLYRHIVNSVPVRPK
ncbi:hypothetical protein FSP39_012684 [Pinctada imbricata]|uniref:Uncharacterized protein n=1 Tax=Pinctada imbricata TaxID=66713 RepID=A0AA89CAM6_PINIB|nr:hypothetical protein FSP39_012684 [Pinctada imbricata]